jgi:hypothetical protein
MVFVIISQRESESVAAWLVLERSGSPKMSELVTLASVCLIRRSFKGL